MKKLSLILLIIIALLTFPLLVGCDATDAPSTPPAADSETPANDSDTSDPVDPPEDIDNNDEEEVATPGTDNSRGIVIALNNNIMTLDPFESRAALDNNIIAAMAESLVDWDESAMNLVGGLAESFEVSEDSLTHTFNLRQGVTFHDGLPFNADAVVANFNHIREVGEGGPRFAIFRTVEELVVIDEYTIQFVHSEPFMPFLERLMAVRILSPAQIESGDFSGPIGTGQFIFREWIDGDRMVMDRNPDWRNADRIGVESVTYRFVPENATRVAMLQSGDADIIYPMPPELLPQIQGDTDFNIQTAPSTVMRFVMMNQDVEPLNDVNVRRAMNYAIDKDAYVQVVRGGFSTVATSPMSNLLPFHYESAGYPVNLERAAQLLDEAGLEEGPDGIRFSLTIWSSTETSEMRAMEFLAQQWAQIGIDVTPVPMEEGTLSDSIWGQTRDTIEMHMWYVSWSAFDPDNALNSTFMSTRHTPAGANANFYTNLDVDAAILAGNAAPTFEERFEYYAFAQRQIMEDAVWIFLGHDERILATAADMTGISLMPTGNWLDLRVIGIAG